MNCKRNGLTGVVGRSGVATSLELLLERLRRLEATVLDALVDSSYTQRLGIPEADRRLIPASVELKQVQNVHELRLQMGRVQQRVAQEPDAPKGGNATKRIQLLLDVPGYGADQADRLANDLSVPAQELGAPRAILARLEAADDQKPTAADFAVAVAALDDLDRTSQTARRVEQSYLRRALFSGPTAQCDLCGRESETQFLVAAHIKKRAECSDRERRDVALVVMAACRFGCDELFERGYLGVDDDGRLILNRATESSQQVDAYVRQHLAGKLFGQPMAGREEAPSRADLRVTGQQRARSRTTWPDPDAASGGTSPCDHGGLRRAGHTGLGPEVDPRATSILAVTLSDAGSQRERTPSRLMHGWAVVGAFRPGAPELDDLRATPHREGDVCSHASMPYGPAVGTVRHDIDVLVKEGLVQTVPGWWCGYGGPGGELGEAVTRAY